MQLILASFLAFCLVFNHTECNDLSVFAHYERAQVIVAAEILDFRFENESLILEINVLEQFKDKRSNILEVTYRHPNAYFEYQSGINWMKNLVGQKFLIYLRIDDNGDYFFETCDRFRSSSEENIFREIAFLKKLDQDNFDEVWVDNSEISRPDKAIPLIDIDSLIRELPAPNVDGGYPVVVTNLLIDIHGNKLFSSNVNFQRLGVTEFNSLTLSSQDRRNDDEITRYFEALSNKVSLWKPLNMNGRNLKTVVTIRWEILSNGDVIYKIL